MEIIVEVVGRSGTVLERQRFNRLPISLGRSYQNDVILLDPFVDAFHGQVAEADDGQLMLQDLGSRNGTSYGGVLLSEAQALMTAGEQVALGKSHLRIFPANVEVVEALPLSSMEAIFHRLSHFWVLMLALILLTGQWLFERYVGHLGEFKLLNHLSDVLGLFGLVFVYGGAWALVGRVVRHDARLFGHCVIAVIAVIVWRGLELLLQWGAFNLNGLEWMPYLDLLLAGLMLLLLLRSSLFLATHLNPWSAHLIALCLPFLLVGVGFFKLLSVNDDFKSYPRYSHQLFAPALQFVSPVEQSSFLLQSETVFQFDPVAEDKD